jgi:LacI family transcriptional regulator, galactose operon repressor
MSTQGKTIKDIAKHAGVSIMTVSRYFNYPDKVTEKTRKRITRAIEILNYQPNEIARSMITKKTYTLGIIVPDIRNPFFSAIFHEIEKYVKPFRYNLLLCNTQEDGDEELRYLKILMSRSVDGIIVAPVWIDTVGYLNDNRIPFVLIDRKFKEFDTDYVGCDHYNGMREAVNFLIEKGHRNIAIINGPVHLYSFAQRSKAYHDAMTKAGLAQYMKFSPAVEITTTDSAYEKAVEILSQSDRPTAIIASNNNIGIGVLKAIKHLGIIIPDRISFLVFDQFTHHDIINPKICCVAQPVELIGRNAAAFMINRLANPDVPKQQLTLRAEFIAGESCRSI